MTGIAVLVALALVLGIFQSTREERDAAAARLAARTRHLWPVPVLLWLLILEPWRWRL